MLRLKSRNHSPIGGFVVAVPELTKDARTFWDFRTAGNSLWDLIKANPGAHSRWPNLPASREQCDDYVDLQNAQRMMTLPGGGEYIITDAQLTPKALPPLWSAGAHQSSPGVAAGVARLTSGAAIIADMFGSDGPTTKADATARAKVCTTCKFNEKQGDWTRWFTAPAAAIIRKSLELVHDMQLSTPYDNQVHYCTACSCPIRVKTYAKMDHIKAHMPEEVRAKLPEWCWVK